METDEEYAAWEKTEALPPYVQSDEQKRRWALAEGIVTKYFDDLPEPSRTEQIWQGTRALYHDPTIPTGDGHV